MLKNTQYNKILRTYDERQLHNKYLLEQRQQEIYKKIPAVLELEQEMASLAAKKVKFLLLSDLKEEGDLSHLYSSSKSLRLQKEALLEAYGYPLDYLQPIYHCHDCKDTGYTTNHQKCHCFKQAVVDLLYTQSNIKTAIKKENFSTFSFEYYKKNHMDETLGLSAYENILQVVAECQNFIEQFDTSNQNLLFYGNAGVGKTFLSNCIAKELLDSAHTVIYLTSFELFDILEKNKFSKLQENYEVEEQFDGILNCDLLIIDDLGTELSNSFTNSQLYLCVNERLLSQKSTIISTNLSLDDLSSQYSERFFSRIASQYTLLRIFGEDIRLKKAFAP